jgi:prepilin-type N-terminal cleavage/methylation domain-containing protein
MPSASRRHAPCHALIRRRGSDFGFTLLELLTVIGVLAILAAFSVGAVRGAKERANIARARSELAALVTALEEYKRLYGDYPQTGEFQQAPATPTGQSATLPNGTGPGFNVAQARLFNCLGGVYGPRSDERGRWVPINGPNLLPRELLSEEHLNGFNRQTGLPRGFLEAAALSGAPSKTDQNYCFVDPWGRRYCYYYKNARNPGAWQATGYVLYSAGKTVASNGTQTPPLNPTTGLMLPTQTAEMLDNIYANP